MPLTIETAEADHLAHDLAQITGESITQVVTVALQERLLRERAKRGQAASLADRVGTLVEAMRKDYDTRPVSQAEWNAAAGDEA